MIYLYIGHNTSFTQNLCKKYSKNGTNEICCIGKSHIKKYKKNEHDNKYANKVHT